MSQISLFRPEAIAHATHKHHGAVFINTPVHYRVITLGCGVFVVCLILFVMFAEFSEKCIVTGYVNSTRGIAHAYPSRQGVIVKGYVSQGGHVKRGDPLFRIDTSDDGLGTSHSRDMFVPLQKRKGALDRDLAHKRQYLQALKPLLRKKYISSTDYQVKHDEILALEKQKNLLEMELIRYKQSRAYVVRAPTDGLVSAVMTHVGQHTQLGKPLLSILPRHAALIVELYIPVAKSGFLNPHDAITIHYDAYPYQRFGAAKGVIQTISQTILTDAEEDKPIRVRQPYYKVTATLDKHEVMAYGKPRQIQQGMTLSAVIIGSKKKLWQWILDPLYSYSGKLWA